MRPPIRHASSLSGLREPPAGLRRRNTSTPRQIAGWWSDPPPGGASGRSLAPAMPSSSTTMWQPPRVDGLAQREYTAATAEPRVGPSSTSNGVVLSATAGSEITPCVERMTSA